MYTDLRKKPSILRARLADIWDELVRLEHVPAPKRSVAFWRRYFELQHEKDTIFTILNIQEEYLGHPGRRTAR